MPHRRALQFIAVASLLATGIVAHGEAEEAAGRLAVTTERVVVFKDGHCLVVKKAVGTSDGTGAVFTEEVPDAAILGCFWATPDEGRLVAMVAGTTASETTTTETFACTGYLEILRANTGKPSTAVELDDGTVVRGTVREVLVREEAQPVAAPPWPRGVAALSPLGEARTATTLSGSLFVMTTEEGDSVLPAARVRRVSVKEAKLTSERTVTTKRTAKRLTFRFEGGAAPRSLHLLYFRPGVRWIPTYRVELPAPDAEPRRARIRLQAELLNEAEDFADVPFDVVVGVPNFRFRQVVSPFVLEGALRDALREAAPQLMGQQMLGGNANAFANRAGEWRAPSSGREEGAASELDLSDEITAARSHDLFTYSLPKLTLRKGERAAVPVFDAEVPCRDVYTWDVHLKRKDIEASPSGAGTSPLALSNDRVWHQVELVNGTSVPWTTGAAFLLEGTRPLAQELLTYTAPGSAVRVPVTVAIDLRAGFSEEETSRQLDAMRWLGNAYAKIEKKGRLDLTSHLADPVEVEVTCDLGGRAVEATHEGKIALDAFRRDDWTDYTGHAAANNHSTVRFLLRVAPRETVSPEIRFHYFTRH